MTLNSFIHKKMNQISDMRMTYGVGEVKKIEKAN